MLENDAADSDASRRPFVEGMPVYDAAGEKIGTVSHYDARVGYLVVHKGWLFRHDVHVPLQVIAHTDASGVHLNLYKDEVLNQDWNAPPVHEKPGTGRAAEYEDPDSPTTTVEMNDVRMPVLEEEIVVDKQEGEIGRVHLHKDVVEEQQTITQPVMREEVQVERVAGGTYANVGPDTFIEKDIDIPVMGEMLITGKRTVVTEEVQLHKQAITENKQITGTVRRERVTVEGADEIRGADKSGGEW